MLALSYGRNTVSEPMLALSYGRNTISEPMLALSYGRNTGKCADFRLPAIYEQRT